MKYIGHIAVVIKIEAEGYDQAHAKAEAVRESLIGDLRTSLGDNLDYAEVEGVDEVECL